MAQPTSRQIGKGHLSHWLTMGLIIMAILFCWPAPGRQPEPTAKHWQLQDAWGEPYTFPTPGKKAHVLIFWASWCPYCHKLMPKVEELYKTLPPESVEFLAINAWDSADPEAFMMEHDYQFPVLVKGETIAPLYGVKAVPEVLVFDSNLKLLYRRQPGQSADEVAAATAHTVHQLLEPEKTAETVNPISTPETNAETGSATTLNNELEDFYAFAPPHGNAIAIQQIPVEERDRYLWVDTRSVEKYRQGHIPGAIHIEWREVFERRNELPRNREIILYCSGGVVAALAMMGLELAGFDNVHTLVGGYSRFVEYEHQRTGNGSTKPVPH